MHTWRPNRRVPMIGIGPDNVYFSSSTSDCSSNLVRSTQKEAEKDE
jgi:hypothetical protein